MKKIFKTKNFPNPYLIAEIGVNHECSIKKATDMIKLAKKGGAHAIKLQSYKAESLASKNAKAYWDTKKEKSENQFNLFKKYDHFEYKDYLKLYKYCKKIGIQFLSTPFDEQAVNYLNKIVPFYKIASADITNIPLIRHVASKKKPIIISSGASNISEIKKAIQVIKKKGSNEICIMHCILNYPTAKKNANLLMIQHLKKEFPDLVIGYSDHTLPDKNMNTLTSAYLLGARIIEKHFTNNKNLKGNDHYHAMDIKDLKLFTKNIEKIKLSVGNSKTKKPIPEEQISRKNARRSLVAANNFKKNYVLKKNDILCKRPGLGISPYFFEKLFNKKLKKNIEKDHLFKWSDFK